MSGFMSSIKPAVMRVAGSTSLLSPAAQRPSIQPQQPAQAGMGAPAVDPRKRQQSIAANDVLGA